MLTTNQKAVLRAVRTAGKDGIMSYIAKRKNRVLRIAEEKKDEYIKMGYTITNDKGEKVADPAITTLEGANAEIERLRKENTELTAKLTEANSEAKQEEAEKPDGADSPTRKKTPKATAGKE